MCTSKWIATIVLALSGFAGIALGCILDGTSQTITVAKPKLPESSDPAHENSWTEAKPVMMEDDWGSGPGSNDDNMGEAKNGPGNTGSGTITNSGGDLFGPRGGDQNGFGEGTDLEVKICWQYSKWVSTTAAAFGNETIIIPAHYEMAWACSEPVEVKPC